MIKNNSFSIVTERMSQLQAPLPFPSEVLKEGKMKGVAGWHVGSVDGADLGRQVLPACQNPELRVHVGKAASLLPERLTPLSSGPLSCSVWGVEVPVPSTHFLGRLLMEPMVAASSWVSWVLKEPGWVSGAARTSEDPTYLGQVT